MATHEKVFDVIVIGGGTAGLVIASRLSEDFLLEVLVLEAGLDLPLIPQEVVQNILTPAANSRLYNTVIDWSRKTTPQVNLNDRQLSIPQGKMLGGSSGLNGLNFTSSSKAVVDGWAHLGNPGWEWSAFSQSLTQVYTVAKSPSQTFKSDDSNGPLRIAYADDYKSGWSKVWADTLESRGFPGAQDTLADGTVAGGLMIPDTVDPESGMRSYAASAYFSSEVRGRSNLTVLTGCEVKKLLLEKLSDGTVITTGVEYVTNGTGATETALAQREVILTAGVFGSPQILELSGIGAVQRLGNAVVDLPGVGENLQNHPMISVSFEVDTENSSAPPTKDAFLRAALQQDMQVLGEAMKEYMEHRSGIFASSGVTSAAQLPLSTLTDDQIESLLLETEPESSGGFAQAHESFVRNILSTSEPSGYYILGPAYAAMNPDGTSELPPMDGFKDSYITVVLLLAHPLSRGSVHVVLEGDKEGLAINPRYLSHPLDVEVMSRHLQFIEKDLAGTEPLASFLKRDGKRGLGAPEAGALKDLAVAKRFIKERVVGAHHFTGTCSMIPQNMGGVVDPLLRVYGTRNLRVCDASIIPLTPRSNPQATVYGLAEHGAKLIRGSLFTH